MALPATDTFDRADGTGLGASWTVINGNFSIVSNQAQGTVSVDYNLVYWSADAAPNDQYSQLVAVAIGADGGGPACRMSGTSFATASYYNIAAFSGSADTVLKVVAGVETSLGSVTSDYANGDLPKISAIGTVVTAYKNGTANGAFSDAAISTGQFGMMNWNNIGYLFNDWEGGDPSAMPVPTRSRKLATQQRMTA